MRVRYTSGGEDRTVMRLAYDIVVGISWCALEHGVKYGRVKTYKYG